MRYAVTDLAGNVLRTGSCGNEEQLAIQAAYDEVAVAVPDDVGNAELYICVGGQWTEKPPYVPTLDELKREARIKVRMFRDLFSESGCDTPSGRVDSNAASQTKINGALMLAQIQGDAYSVDWRMQDNSIVTLNAPQMIAVGISVGQHVAATQAHKNALDAFIDAAQSEAELDAISLQSGWPE